MNVSIYSRESVKKLIETDFPENTAVISFYDPEDSYHEAEYEKVDYSRVTDRVFYVCIRDIDLSVLPEYGLTYDTYFTEADEMAQFVLQARKDGMDIICQCEYGESRSSGCAAAIREYFYGDGIEVFADYRYYPNQLVYHKVFDALKKSGHKSYDDGKMRGKGEWVGT